MAQTAIPPPRSVPHQNQIQGITITAPGLENAEELPPPPYTPNNRSVPFPATASNMPASTAVPELAAQVSRLTLRGGYLHRQGSSPSQQTIDFPSATAYFEDRPCTIPRPGYVLEHGINLSGELLTRDNLPFPAPSAQYLERDVNEMDWSTFVNYLLPPLVETGDGDKATEGAALQSSSSAAHTLTAEQRARMIAVLEEWNARFFAPRGVHVDMDSVPSPSASTRPSAAPSYVTDAPPMESRGVTPAQTSALLAGTPRAFQALAAHGVSNSNGKSPLQWAKDLLSKAAAAIPCPPHCPPSHLPQSRSAHGCCRGRELRSGRCGRRRRDRSSTITSSSNSDSPTTLTPTTTTTTSTFSEHHHHQQPPPPALLTEKALLRENLHTFVKEIKAQHRAEKRNRRAEKREDCRERCRVRREERAQRWEGRCGKREARREVEEEEKER